MGIFDWLFGKKKKDTSVYQQDFDRMMEDPNSHVDYNDSEVNRLLEDGIVVSKEPTIFDMEREGKKSPATRDVSSG